MWIALPLVYENCKIIKDTAPMKSQVYKNGLAKTEGAFNGLDVVTF